MHCPIISAMSFSTGCIVSTNRYKQLIAVDRASADLVITVLMKIGPTRNAAFWGLPVLGTKSRNSLLSPLFSLNANTPDRFFRAIPPFGSEYGQTPNTSQNENAPKPKNVGCHAVDSILR